MRIQCTYIAVDRKSGDRTVTKLNESHTQFDCFLHFDNILQDDISYRVTFPK